MTTKSVSLQKAGIISALLVFLIAPILLTHFLNHLHTQPTNNIPLIPWPSLLAGIGWMIGVMGFAHREYALMRNVVPEDDGKGLLLTFGAGLCLLGGILAMYAPLRSSPDSQQGWMTVFYWVVVLYPIFLFTLGSRFTVPEEALFIKNGRIFYPGEVVRISPPFGWKETKVLRHEDEVGQLNGSWNFADGRFSFNAPVRINLGEKLNQLFLCAYGCESAAFLAAIDNIPPSLELRLAEMAREGKTGMEAVEHLRSLQEVLTLNIIVAIEPISPILVS